MKRARCSRSRRAFTTSTLTALAALGFSRRSFAQAASAGKTVPPEVGKANPAREEHQPTAPGGLQLGASHHPRLVGLRIMDQDAVVPDLGEEKETALPVLADGRQRDARQPRPLRGNGTSFEPELLGSAQHFRNADRAAGPEPVPQLLGIDRKPMKAQEHHQLGEAGIRVGLLIHPRENS